jgi:4-hydroxy-tetrahydrodipicolinate reductase
MVRIGISGACGKMGLKIAALALKEPEKFKITGAFEWSGSPFIGKDLGEALGTGNLGVIVSSDMDKGLKDVDCLIEFTLPEPTLSHLPIVVKHGVPTVIGTTGIDAAGETAIKDASKTIPIVFSPNMSMGVNTLFKIVSEAARVLGKDFVIKTDETHHVHKKDAPSGTAKMIARVIKESSGVDAPVEVFREGEVVGNHGIIFESPFETLEIRHDAKSRDVFAAGALKGALFLAGKKPGFYTMGDVLGIK